MNRMDKTTDHRTSTDFPRRGVAVFYHRCCWVIAFFTVALLAFGGAACVDDETPAEDDTQHPETATQEAVPEAWQEFRRDVRDRAYPIESGRSDGHASGSATYRAQHPDHSLRGEFDESGLRVSPHEADESSSVHVSLDRWGRNGAWHNAEQTPPKHSESRLSFHHDDLVEWYIHDARGIEQGFDLARRPSGEGPLRVELSVDTDLTTRAVDRDTVQFVSKTGRHVLRYGDLQVIDADGKRLEARLESGKGSLAIEIDDRDARYPIMIDPWFTNSQIAAPDTDDAMFGNTTDADGELLIVGAEEHGEHGTNGAAYIHDRNEGGADEWGTVKTLGPSTFGDRLGASVGIAGELAAVGAPEDIEDGQVLIYEQNEPTVNNWGEVATLEVDGAENFGEHIAFEEDRLLVGAPESDQAFLFERDGAATDDWNHTRTWQRDDLASSVDLDGDRALIGARLDDEHGAEAGAAYLFERDVGGADNWGERAKLVSSQASGEQLFGSSVDLDGDHAVVGAPRSGDGGEVFLFGRDEGGQDNWGEIKPLGGSDIEPGGQLGRSVSIDDGHVLAGAPETDYDYDGRVHVYGRDWGGADNWGHIHALPPNNAQLGSGFGASVTVDGDWSFVGVTGYNGGFGHGSGGVFVYEHEPNESPEARDVTISVEEDDSKRIAPIDNDTDPEDDDIHLEGFDYPEHGRLEPVDYDEEQLRYTPEPDFNGDDSFEYTVSDSWDQTVTGTVDIEVLPVNDPPVAEDDIATTDEDEAVTIDVLGNDRDIDESDTLTVDDVSNPQSGTATHGESDVTYDPNADFTGADTFEYTVADEEGETDTARVDIWVEAANDGPRAENDEATTTTGEAVVVDVLSNDGDVDSEVLTVEVTTDAEHGTTQEKADQTIVYTPEAEFTGEDTFEYRLEDRHGEADTADVTITVESPGECSGDDCEEDADAGSSDSGSAPSLADDSEEGCRTTGGGPHTPLTVVFALGAFVLMRTRAHSS